MRLRSAKAEKESLCGPSQAAVDAARLSIEQLQRLPRNRRPGHRQCPAAGQGAAQTASDGEIFWYITKGDVNNGMPSWASLPEEATVAGRHIYKVAE